MWTAGKIVGFGILLTGIAGDVGRADPAPRKERPANHLAAESSPYLLMHAHNPVDWYPWGPVAFAKAKKEGKLVFLSIGYSSCYWCHVMERESFENDDVAKLLNDWFVCIKVDREERPDIDNVYMTSLQVIRQQGGWPLSMFLTADAKPIVGGTYWPAEDRDIEGRKMRGFKSILKFIHQWASDKPQELRKQADAVAEYTTLALAGAGRAVNLTEPGRDLVDRAVEGLKEEYDSVHGGFSGAPNFRGPKFPTPTYLELLLHEAERTRSAELMTILNHTLDRMAWGGIYDQLGGGFHRYSTERTWTVPHFEKMLYDNAQLVEVYSRAFALTKNPEYQRVVRETLDFVSREMTSPEGGFYSALDAETGNEEGRYYVWTAKEIEDALGNPADVELVTKVYGANGAPNFEDKYSILTLVRPPSETAKQLMVSGSELAARIEPLKQKLLDARAKRARPFRDTKILTGWNGEMIAGYAVAGQLLNEPGYVQAASRAADFVLAHLKTPEGRLLRTYGAQPGKDSRAKLNAYLDDYAFLVHGLLNLHDATNDAKWLREARELTETMTRLFADKDRGGFFYTSADHEKLFARSKDQFDSAQPSGNSVVARNLVRLCKKTGEAGYRRQAEASFKAFAVPLKTNGVGMTTMAEALAMFLDDPTKKGTADLGDDAGGGKQGGPRKSDAVVKVTAEAGKPDADGKQEVTIKLAIDKGWHTYANPTPADFPGQAVTVTITAKTKPEDVKPEYPEGKLVKDAVVGDHRIYEDTVTIKAKVVRAKGDDSPLEISVKLQACTEQKCLLPATVKLTAP